MSAWMDLVNANGSDEWLELCSRALEEVQRETSRRNAAKIRRLPLSPAALAIGGTVAVAQRQGINAGADLIDPEPTP